MGRRLENWLSKANTETTRSLWLERWRRFAKWAVSATNPLTGQPYMDCDPEMVDDVIRQDFESMASHLFQDKYRDMLTKYVASLSDSRSNTAAAYVSSVRSFFTNEAVSIKLQNGKIPRAEMALNEHRFTLEELHRMWMVADTEGKARLSVATSLGWGIGDFIQLDKRFVANTLRNEDADGFVTFDYRRRKTRARIRGILNPNAVADLNNYVPRIPQDQTALWSIQSKVGVNKWLKSLVDEAGITPSGTIRFHLLRKYTFDIVSSQCGMYEAKLLVGKQIPLADATYLHGLEDRLLERYKKFAYPLLNLNGVRRDRDSKLDTLEQKLEHQGRVLDFLQEENTMLKKRMNEIVEARKESDEVMDQLFQDPEFKIILRRKVEELKL